MKEIARYALMTRGNNGNNPEYKYWTHRLSGPKSNHGGCCAKTFLDAISRLKAMQTEDQQPIHLVGIFDGITERDKEQELFKDIQGRPVLTIHSNDEHTFTRPNSYKAFKLWQDTKGCQFKGYGEEIVYEAWKAGVEFQLKQDQ